MKVFYVDFLYVVFFIFTDSFCRSKPPKSHIAEDMSVLNLFQIVEGLIICMLLTV